MEAGSACLAMNLAGLLHLVSRRHPETSCWQELGGAKYMVLSHRDDVADHAQWAQALGATRIIHRLEANRSQRTEYAL